MSNVQLDEPGLETLQEVITSRDYESCPIIKSSNGINTIIVVKSNGNSQSIQAGTNHGDDNHYEPLESSAVGVLLQ